MKFSEYLIENKINFIDSSEGFISYVEKHHPDWILPDKLQDKLMHSDILVPGYIELLKNPNRKFQEFIFYNEVAYFWSLLNNIDKDILQKMLTDDRLVRSDEDGETYNNFVKKQFKGNQLLMNKWIRYGESTRNEI